MLSNFKQTIRPKIYQFRHNLLTPNVILIALASFLAISWVVSAIMAMQQNYNLQKKVNKRKQQLAILQIETDSLAIEKDYYGSAEYQELIARQSLGLGSPGEKVLILPSYSKWVTDKQIELSQKTIRSTTPVSNFNQWINFLFGGNRSKPVK